MSKGLSNEKLMKKIEQIEQRIIRDHQLIRIGLLVIQDYAKEAYFMMLMTFGLGIGVTAAVVWQKEQDPLYLFMAIVGLVLGIIGSIWGWKHNQKVKAWKNKMEPYFDELLKLRDKGE